MSTTYYNQAVEPNDHSASRLKPVDALRGLLMILMALDHANWFVARQHSTGEYWGGPFPVYDDVLAFLTRLMTHLSAPGFFLLMGVGIALFAQSRREQGWSLLAIGWRLLVRGAILIAMQLLVVNVAWTLSPGGWGVSMYIGVLFALGATMIQGSLLVWLKPVYLLVLSGVLMVTIEWLAPDPSLWGSAFDAVNNTLLVPGGVRGLWVTYPVLPWLELVTFGMVLGHWLKVDRVKAYKRALWLGVTFLIAFSAIRFADGFGNLRPRPGNTWIDYLNVVKYPPSIAFTLLTTGVNLILLSWFGGVREGLQRLVQPLVVFGRQPLFFYVTHLFLYAALGHVLTPAGTSIPGMYPYWLLGLLVLYPLCLWYGSLQRRWPERSILRLL